MLVYSTYDATVAIKSKFPEDLIDNTICKREKLLNLYSLLFWYSPPTPMENTYFNASAAKVGRTKLASWILLL